MSTSGRLNSKKGFTLVEITVVMLIVGIFAMVSLPKLSALGGMKLEKDARRLAHTITYLYAQAAAQGVIIRLYFDLETGQYHPEFLNEQDTFEQTSLALFSGGRLAESTHVRSFKTAFSGTFIGETAYIYFMPEGFAEEAVIVLRDSDRSLSLIVDPLTGRVRINEGEYKTELGAKAA